MNDPVHVYARVCVCVWASSMSSEWKQKSGCMKHIYVANNKRTTENSNSISNSFSLNRKNRTQNYNNYLLLFFHLKESLLWSVLLLSASRSPPQHMEQLYAICGFLNLKLPKLFGLTENFEWPEIKCSKSSMYRMVVESELFWISSQQ